jgi:hypothetical protein
VGEGRGATFGGETWVELPGALVLALRASGANPTRGPLRAAFTLPAAAPATLELVDLAGRRLVAQEVGSLGVGSHVVELTPARPLVPGIYWMRLTQGGRRLTAKAVVVD